MKQKKQITKLALNQKTIANLDLSSMNMAKGGALPATEGEGCWDGTGTLNDWTCHTMCSICDPWKDSKYHC